MPKQDGLGLVGEGIVLRKDPGSGTILRGIAVEDGIRTHVFQGHRPAPPADVGLGSLLLPPTVLEHGKLVELHPLRPFDLILGKPLELLVEHGIFLNPCNIVRGHEQEGVFPTQNLRSMGCDENRS